MDMKSSLPAYLSEHSSEEITSRTIEDIVSFNLKDLKNRAPYGQALFDGIIADTTSNEEFEKIKSELERNSRSFFDELMKTYNLDAVLSINNFHAGFAAVAKYPCMTLSMGYKEDGEPQGITLIVQNDQEILLYQLAFRMEEELKARKMPEKYK
jgi:amidase